MVFFVLFACILNIAHMNLWRKGKLKEKEGRKRKEKKGSSLSASSVPHSAKSFQNLKSFNLSCKP